MRVVLVLLALFALPQTGCRIGEGEYFGRVEPPDEAHFRWCNSGEPEFVDPALVSTTNGVKVTYALFDGLTTHDKNGLPEPSMATHWDISEDMRRFKFHLRDDLRWSDGTPITSRDFARHLVRVLHPSTASRNAETLWVLRNGSEFTHGLVKVLLSDAPSMAAGEVVHVLPPGDETPPPDTNAFTAARDVDVRSAPDDTAAAHARLATGGRVTLIELDEARRWAYVYHQVGEGFYGWVPLAALRQTHADHVYTIASAEEPTVTAEVRGADLLLLPGALGIETPDARTLVLETTNPVPYFVELTLHATFRPAPRHAVEAHPRRWTEPAFIVTSGPFHMTGWIPRDKIELVKSDTFWNRDDVALGRVTIYSLSDQSASVNMYYQGACDALVANNIPVSFLPVLGGDGKRAAKKDYHQFSQAGIYFVMVNTQRFGNVHLRKALAHALDRSQLPTLLKGGQVPVTSYTPGQRIGSMSASELALCEVSAVDQGVALLLEAGSRCYVPPKGAGFDLEAARAELALARGQMGDAFPDKLTFKFNSGVEQHKLIAEWVQYQWERTLGIRVELESQEWKVYVNDTLPGVGAYDLGRMGWIGNLADPGAEFLPNYLCDSPNNRPGWCSSQYDALLAQAAKERDPGKRLALLAEAEALMIAEQPIIPLFVYTQHVLVKPYVTGLFLNLFDHQSLREVSVEPDWKRPG